MEAFLVIIGFRLSLNIHTAGIILIIGIHGRLNHRFLLSNILRPRYTSAIAL